MRKLFIFIFLCVISINTFGSQSEVTVIDWTVSAVDPVAGGLPEPKSPINLPQATLDGHVLTFTSSHADYTLTLLDENGDDAYQVFVPASTSVVVLPSTLSGAFEIQLDFGGSYIFVSDIVL